MNSQFVRLAGDKQSQMGVTALDFHTEVKLLVTLPDRAH